MKSYKIKEKETGIFWKYEKIIVSVFLYYICKNKIYYVGIKTYRKRNEVELLSRLSFWNNLKDVVEFLEKNSNKKVELVEDI